MQVAMSQSTARDLVLLAPTGSGKTIAFSLYMMQRVEKRPGTLQAVVLAPSRELVLQIVKVVKNIAVGLKCSALYGGHSMTDEVNTLSVVPEIIVATPGRLLDHLQRRQIDLSTVSTLVIDEYDKSLELGFADEMRRIARRFTSVKNYVLTSATPLATIPDFMKVGSVETLDFTMPATGESVSKRPVVGVESSSRDKLDTLIALLESIENTRVIIFVNHRESAERVYNALIKAGFPAGLYHGALQQNEREQAIALFDNGTTPVLVSTDLASRGLDIDNVGAVIHYHIAPSEQSWTHRNGRTARQQATGIVYVITSEADNIPDFITFDRRYFPTKRAANPIHSDTATLYFNVGRKEKISRGDIVGYLAQKGGLTAGEIGKIVLNDHNALVAVPALKAKDAAAAVAPHKIKNTRARVSILK